MKSKLNLSSYVFSTKPEEFKGLLSQSDLRAIFGIVSVIIWWEGRLFTDVQSKE